MMLACLLACWLPQDPHLAAVSASQARRVAVVERCAAAVCSVMAMDEPGGGSGVIFDPSGLVLTNYHVVGNPDDEYEPSLPDDPAEREDVRARGAAHYRNKKVGLPDGQLYEAEVLGIDPGSDLAVLRLLPRIPNQTWPAMRLGDSDRLLVGETVFAMGNPFLLATDFTPTVTFGIVSGTHRYQEGQGQRLLVYPDCIQVDAPVNPGNSGGPLFNEAGEVIGINGRISIGDRGRVNVGVGFAISSNQIRNFLGDLLAGRHAEHGTLDMSAWFMNSGTGDSRRRGVFVQQLFKDSVVAAAGLGLGDELTMFNGVEVRSANQLATMVGVLPAGTWVSVGFRPRQADDSFGEERRVEVRLTRLDTGSSRDGTEAESRLASPRNRRAIKAALSREWSTAPGPTGVEWVVTAPDNTPRRLVSDGSQLRIEAGTTAMIAPAAGEHFGIDGGAARDLSADERALLERQRRCNPFTWLSGSTVARLADAEFLGGVHVLGAPAYRFGLPGDGECEAWLFLDGTPAGCTFRDPVRRAKVEWHCRPATKGLRLIVDGKVETGWSFARYAAGEVDAAWFRRP